MLDQIGCRAEQILNRKVYSPFQQHDELRGGNAPDPLQAKAVVNRHHPIAIISQIPEPLHSRPVTPVPFHEPASEHIEDRRLPAAVNLRHAPLRRRVDVHEKRRSVFP